MMMRAVAKSYNDNNNNNNNNHSATKIRKIVGVVIGGWVAG